MQKRFINLSSIILVTALLLNIAGITGISAAADEAKQTVSKLNISDNSGLAEYQSYLEVNKKYSNAENDILVSGGDFSSQIDSSVKKDRYETEENVAFWEKGDGTVLWEINAEADGLYNFYIEFLPLKDGTDIELGFLIDGKIPFAEAEKLTFSKDWINATDKPRVDIQGNEIAPEQILSGKFVSRVATDKTGVVLEPFKFMLEKGVHTLSLVGNGYAIAVSKLGFTAPEEIKDYETISKDYKIEENKNVSPIVIHAEDASLKSNNTLIPKATNGNAGMYPASPYLTKINNIGGSNWNMPGDKITWEFTVKKAGYYYFGARYKQNELVGGESWRWLKIDGKTPFEEAKNLRFKYDTDWKEYVFGEGKAPYYFYLGEGKHTLSLEVTLGELAEYYDRLSKIVSKLGDMYLNIVMITGETPDVNRDYELFRQIPDFTDVLTEQSNQLKALVKDMKSLTGTNGNQYTSAMNNMSRIIDRMLDSKFIAHIYVKDYYTNYTTLSSWLGDMKELPLYLDEIKLCFAGSEIDWNEPDFFENFLFGLKRLIYSYTDDYMSITSNSDKASLKLWVNWGRDQTMALDSLIRDSFTAKTGIKVELQIVSNSLINGLLANNFPDVQLHLSRTSPVNYGMRGALLDLSQFPDYKEVLTRFADEADKPYWYNGALYAIPDTQNFYTMFYRTDVFNQLNLSVPKTWDEFLYCATIIQRYNMNVYVPYTQITSATTVNSGIGNLNMYPTLMMQSGIDLYNKEQNATNLISPEAIGVFEKWTQMYSDYGYLKEADFYNRFRNGSMPLGIAHYSTYLTIYSAAPEIQGRWSIANVPGFTEQNNYVAGGGTGCGIVRKSKHHKEAWEFLKWWTSAETQTRYSNNVESILGMLGRVSTSNIEAFKSLSWKPDDLEKLLAQYEKVREVPEVPGSYYFTRAVDQAFWSVINNGNNPKDAITEWSEVADLEIARKIKEYS